MSGNSPAVVVAAGAVVLRRYAGTTQVLVAHRPKYDDWTLPKGKLDPGEGIRTAAVREVHEETGARIRLGPPLAGQEYPIDGGRAVKQVHYWSGRLLEDYDVESYKPNDEIDEVRWVATDDMDHLLTFTRDQDTVTEALRYRKRTVPLVVLRHTDAHDRPRWKGDDRERALTSIGEEQATRLVPDLAAYGVERLVSSSSRRCWATLAPYGVEIDRSIEVTHGLSEEDATADGVSDEVEDLLTDPRPAVLCTHRPVLPLVFRALRIDPLPLEKGAMLVLHHRRGRVVATEHVPAP